MSRLVFDGNYHVYWLDTDPASVDAPTTTEITAGTEITAFIPKDGFNPGINNNRVNAGDLSTIFEAEDMGTWSSQLAVSAYRDDGEDADVAWDTFGDYGSTGCIIVCPFGAAAADQPAMVWPSLRSGAPMVPPTAGNERQKFTAEFAVGAQPSFKAVVTTPPGP